MEKPRVNRNQTKIKGPDFIAEFPNLVKNFLIRVDCALTLFLRDAFFFIVLSIGVGRIHQRTIAEGGTMRAFEKRGNTPATRHHFINFQVFHSVHILFRKIYIAKIIDTQRP